VNSEKIRATRSSLEVKILIAEKRLRGLRSKLGGLRENCPHVNMKESQVPGDYYSKGNYVLNFLEEMCR
jgi:hypothetical protein